MNLAIRGINGNLGGKNADSFHNDLHKDLKADYILANPPFNVSGWGAEHLADDIRWKYGIPYNGNANYAWIQHFIHHLSPHGIAGFVLANGALSSNTSSDSDVRKKILEDDLVDCIVALPSKLFYSTGIPVSLWFLSKNKGGNGGRKRDGETLFVDARKMGTLVDRAHRELTEEDLKKISDTYHAWKGTAKKIEYEDIKGFCKAAQIEKIREHEHILTPGRYIGIEEKKDDEPFEDKMARLTDELAEQFAKSNKLEEEIRDNLRVIGYEF
jgi:type I restriction enzyme M protein